MNSNSFFRRKLKGKLRSTTSIGIFKFRLLFLVPIALLTLSTFSAFVALSKSIGSRDRHHLKQPIKYPPRNYTKRNVTYSELPSFIDVIRSLDSDLIIDTISMGNIKSEQNRLMLKSQKETWLKSIPGTRWFFAATEDVCFPDCMTETQNVTFYERDQLCNVRQDRKIPPQGDRPSFWTAGKPARLKSHSNKTMGWWCAQKRAARAMQILLDVYQSSDNGAKYPDWLLLVDDDTWFNPYFLPKVLRRLDEEGIPMAASPSLLYANTKTPIFFGGAGLAINKRLLQELVRPVICHYGNRKKEVCRRLGNAGYMSRFQFLDGMSLMDMVMELLKRRVSCLHSDWWQSLLVYLAGYKMRKTDCKECFGDKLRGNMTHMDIYALHMVGTCGPNMLSCHRMTEARMKEMTERSLQCSKSNFTPAAICKKLENSSTAVF